MGYPSDSSQQIDYFCMASCPNVGPAKSVLNSRLTDGHQVRAVKRLSTYLTVHLKIAMVVNVRKQRMFHQHVIDVSIVMPDPNDATTLLAYIGEARLESGALQREHRLTGEVIFADDVAGIIMSKSQAGPR